MHQPGSSSRLPFGMESGDFELESGAPVHSIIARPETDAGGFGLHREVLAMAPGFASLAQLPVRWSQRGGAGRRPFSEILKLYNFTNSSYSVKQIEGITDLKSRRQFSTHRIGKRRRLRARHAG